MSGISIQLISINMCLPEVKVESLPCISENNQRQPPIPSILYKSLNSSSVNGPSSTTKCIKSVKFTESLVDETVEIPRILDNERENLFYSKQDIRKFKDEYSRFSFEINASGYSLVISFKKRDTSYLTPASTTTSLRSKIQNNFPFQRKHISRSSPLVS